MGGGIVTTIYRDYSLEITKDFLQNVSTYVGDTSDAEPVKRGNTIIGWDIVPREECEKN